MDDIGHRLRELVGRAAPPRGASWFAGITERLDAGWDRSAFIGAFAAATLKLGKELGELDAPEPHLRRWWIDEAGRAALLCLAAARAPAAEFPELVEDCYVHGENRERQGVLRALELLPGPERFLAIAVDAGRTSVQTVFESIACENGYPARFFPELNFNQLVLKSLFNGVALERVVGLSARINPELVRMATAYADERRAAGRPVPADIARFITTPPGTGSAS